ncbi:fatty acid desaturase [Cylindrospermopsis raciborskii]|uniref:Fatty acid desaturase n=1 Tax=Cylindrospermopsis raciborskii CENA302 TaxID=1170768 RepID=A0A9Q5W7Z8_9CYAN|nr:fatty acid desaturase [Cylindrospermopsis raciborskii]MCZ2202255.1 fatty acid desaturase [Cylindrospermopsis raciborskii PAMP2012]MCZ2205317.1 fatty acid desaturase [Cylindrospermopsis raciborskii PAMP2011]NLQ04211.1 fatty acid desaturase [Cylindrospermopsis raciborskii MVCC19]OHY33784.1 fatty acid desaturase [Cylindrospermopsis raciborskii MVCC14]OPH08950.1 fatty acid desaturase [Cylindrospermopsis raciborskii CENA302]
MTTSLIKDQENLVYPTLGEDEIKLKHIIKSLPKECFQKNSRKAWTRAIISLTTVGLGYYFLAISPWFLLPVAWIFTGTALTGFFVIGHDCGHRSFANRHWVNDLVGHLFMMPLIYPFHSWRIKHNYHHKHTNKLEEDNAWHPIRVGVFGSWGKIQQSAFELFIRKRLWWIGSIGHWAVVHFNPGKFQKKDRASVKLSVGVVIAFAVIVFPTLIFTTGLWGFIKFWFIPWMVYHFWMSTFTIVHHTTADVPFKTADKWNEALAQLFGTIHCDYPRWVEILCHDINVHVPHHISTAIPSYNLRLAYKSIKQNWRPFLHNEFKFSWDLMKKITNECQLYQTDIGYITFDEYYAQKQPARK